LISGNQEYALVDGGVFVNNPSMAAYAEARYLYPEAQRIVVLSVGTGDRQDQITYAQAKGWGLLGWAKQIVPVLMDSVSEAVDYELAALPGCVYYRLQIPHLQDASNEMDDVDPQNLANLQAIASEYAKSVSDVLTKSAGNSKKAEAAISPAPGRSQPAHRKCE
jgi:hypothetical protein